MKVRDEEAGRSGRDSRRRAPPAQPTCILTMGSQRLPAMIDEERGGTMHVIIQGSPQFWVEESGELSTPDGVLSVRVFNIVRLEGEEGDPAGSIPRFRIGLERLGHVHAEIEDSDDDEDQEAAQVKIEELIVEENARQPFRNVLIFSAIASILILAAAAWLRNPSTSHHSSSTAETPILPPAGSANQQPSAAAPVSVSPRESTLLVLPGVQPFVQTEIISKLGLTPEQVESFQRLDRTTQQAVEDLEKYWGPEGRWELPRRRQELLDAARQEALQLLTDTQRKLWNAMKQ